MKQWKKSKKLGQYTLFAANLDPVLMRADGAGSVALLLVVVVLLLLLLLQMTKTSCCMLSVQIGRAAEPMRPIESVERDIDFHSFELDLSLGRIHFNQAGGSVRNET